MCTGTLVHHERSIRERAARPRPGRRMRRVCTGTPVHYEQTYREEDTASVHWYTGNIMSKESGNEWPGQVQGGGYGECVRVHWYTMSNQVKVQVKVLPAAGSRGRSSRTGTPVHYWQTVKERVSDRPRLSLALGVALHVQVHRYTMSKQSGNECPTDPACHWLLGSLFMYVSSCSSSSRFVCASSSTPFSAR